MVWLGDDEFGISIDVCGDNRQTALLSVIETDGTTERAPLIRRRARLPLAQTTKETLMIVVRRTYTPKPGGGGLQRHLRDLQAATVEAGFPALSVYRKVLGPHGTMVTTQPWESMAAYDASRDQVRATRSITEIFEKIYPVLASTHETEIYEEMG